MNFAPIEKLITFHREVTNEPEYSNENMAKLGYKMPEKDYEATFLKDNLVANNEDDEKDSKEKKKFKR